MDYDDWERQAKRDIQLRLDSIFDRCAGQPVSVVKAALEQESVSDPELSQLAQAISEGKRLNII